MRDKLNRRARDWFKVRKYAVNRWRKDKMPVRRIAAMLGVSRQVVYKWIRRWKENKCWAALRDKPQQAQDRSP
ncbi:MAG: helix-turn-helix domain-containing protein [Thermoplasmata archaeon]|nr:helix-turn-helix domain-containing protein [Thermoplasmata archaeon]